jgi:CHAT domain-containing protein/Tfp pilus assembly protein PilF
VIEKIKKKLKGIAMKKFLIFICILFVIVLNISHAQSWQALMDSTNFYQEKQDFETALQWAEKALLQAEKEFGKIDTNYASTLGSVSEIFYYLGNLDSAIYYGDIHLSICRILLKTDHRDLAQSIGCMAVFYHARGDYKLAEPLFKEALEMRRRLFKGDNIDLAANINNFAYLLLDIGNYKQSETLFKEALDMFRRIYNGDHPDLAQSINNMAVFYHYRGDYKQAEPLYKEALEMRRRIFKGDNGGLALSIDNMASLYKSRGDYKQAEPLFKEALEMRRRIYKGDHPYLANSINSMAVFYVARGDYKQAEPLFKEALGMRRHLYKSDHPDLALSINNMAYFYEGRSRYLEAEPLYKEALEMYRRLFKGDNPYLATSINSMALFYNERGRYAEAEPLFKEALAMRRRFFKEDHEDHPDLALSINNMAYFYNSRSRYSEAEPLYLEALRVNQNILNNYFPSLSEKEKGQFWSTMKDDFESFNSFAINRMKDNPAILHNFYDNCLMTKGMLLNASNKVRSRILSCNDTSLIELFNSWKDKREYIAKLYQLSKAQLEKKHINLDSIINSANEQEKELSKLSEDFAKEYDKKQVKWEDVQGKLKPDEAAIEIVRFRYYDKKRFTDTVYYAALIVRRRLPPPAPKSSGDIKLVLLINGNELEGKYIEQYSNYILLGSGKEKSNLTDNISYNQYWKPIAKELTGIKTLYLSPDGVYNKLNLLTLYNPETKKYLLDEMDIHIVGSTRDLVNKPQNLAATKVKSAELFGDVRYNLDSAEHIQLAMNYSKTDMAEISRGVFDSLTTRSGYGPLPGTRKEVENISELLKEQGWEVKTHLGEEALEEAIKSVNNPGILHIATHGMFLTNVENTDENERTFGMETKRFVENPLLRSMLLFAGAENTINSQGQSNSNTKIDDGLLTAFEAQNLNLDKTDLVVLSACNTGLGEIKNGEGVYGLQRAFIKAGAKTLIMSLWEVNDETTQELMTMFYIKWLSGKTKRDAFKEAQKELKKKHPEPYYWGAFVMVGE